MSKGIAILSGELELPNGWQVRPLIFVQLEDQGGQYWRTFTRCGRDYRIDPPDNDQRAFTPTMWRESPFQRCIGFEKFEAAEAGADRDFDTFVVSALVCSKIYSSIWVHTLNWYRRFGMLSTTKTIVPTSSGPGQTNMERG